MRLFLWKRSAALALSAVLFLGFGGCLSAVVQRAVVAVVVD